MDKLKWIQLGLTVIVLILLVILFFRKPEAQQNYYLDNTEIMAKLDSLARFRDTIKETKTIIREKYYETKHEIDTTTDTNQLILLFWKYLSADSAGFNRYENNYW